MLLCCNFFTISSSGRERERERERDRDVATYARRTDRQAMLCQTDGEKEKSGLLTCYVPISVHIKLFKYLSELFILVFCH